MRNKLTEEENKKLESHKGLLNTEISCLSNREFNWTVFYYSNLNIAFNKNIIFSCEEDFVHEICRHPDIRKILNILKEARQDSLISSSLTNWIKKDKRAQFFLLCIMRSYVNSWQNRFPTTLKIKEPMDFTLLYLDMASIPHANQHITKIQEKQHKEIFVKNVQKTYSLIKEYETYDEWLACDDYQQIKWVKEYLVKHQLLINYEGFHDPEEDYAQCLASLDLFGIMHNSPMFYPNPEKALFIKKMKAGWAQKKYRDAGKTKKPHHLPMTKSTIEKLKKISALNNLPEGKMIEYLIEAEYDASHAGDF